MEQRIYLASRSPRRRELLTQMGVRFDLMLFRAETRQDAETLEDELPGEPSDAYVRRVALAKAAYGVQLIHSRHLIPRIVLAADTTLDLDGAIIGKPRDESDARAILARLSGRSHTVLTAVAIADGDVSEVSVSSSKVRFRNLGSDEIRRYVNTGEPLDKAGAYGLQGHAAIFIEEVQGSPSGIVGLPLCETALLLRRFGYPI